MGGQALNETFTVEDGFLVRRVVPARGEPYEHRCAQASFVAVAQAADAMTAGQETIAQEILVARTGLPWSQVAVALAFLKERGCIVAVHGRGHKGASDFVFEDAMIEYHALREKPGGTD